MEELPRGPSLASVDFVVHVPVETPPDDNVYLILVSFFDGSEIARIPMSKENETTWRARIDNLVIGALVRYTYDRGWSDWERRETTRENFGSDIAIKFRRLLVSENVMIVEDRVSRWRDIQSFPPSGKIVGMVRDKKTGKPIIDATVSIAGVHLGTDHEGRFELEDVPAGKQRVTVTTVLGDYKPHSQLAEVKAGETTEILIELEPARRVNVTFEAVVPERTPENAIVKIAGNVYQLGSVCWQTNGLTPDPARWVRMQRISENIFLATLELYEGTYVEYVYTLGLNHEVSPTGEIMFRSFVVENSDMKIRDVINGWEGQDLAMLTLNVTVPPNTPSNEPIFIDVGGPILPMDRISEHRWTFTYFSGPGSWDYKYVRGMGGKGHERLDGSQVFRTVEIPENDLVVEDEVLRWKWFPENGYPPIYEFRVENVKPRKIFVNGIFFSDFWWPNITPLIYRSLKHLDEINCDWVALAHAWSWERVEPVPELSSRSIRTTWSSMPIAELKEVVQELKARGKKVWLSLYMDEGTTAGMSFWEPHPAEWYDHWYQEAKRFYLFHAKVAEELGIDALQLHGVQLFQYDAPELRQRVDNYMRDIISEMRQVYSGYLISDGPPTGYTHYELLDFIGVSVWEDLGVSNDASVEELKAAFDRYFDGEVRQYHEESGKPVIITQFAYPSIDGGANQAPYISAFGEDDPSVVLDLEEQARIYEAAFRSIAEREWIVGLLPFGYSYIDLPESKDETIRGKPAELVLAAYYQAFREATTG